MTETHDSTMPEADRYAFAIGENLSANTSKLLLVATQLAEAGPRDYGPTLAHAEREDVVYANMMTSFCHCLARMIVSATDPLQQEPEKRGTYMAQALRQITNQVATGIDGYLAEGMPPAVEDCKKVQTHAELALRKAYTVLETLEIGGDIKGDVEALRYLVQEGLDPTTLSPTWRDVPPSPALPLAPMLHAIRKG